MRRLCFVRSAVLAGVSPLASANDIAPGGTLRAVYLGSNPAQAVQDRATGEIRGASADLARELAKRIDMPLDLKPAANPPGVIDAVSSGAADIGFVAYEPSRAGTVEFSQTYMLVQPKLSRARRLADPGGRRHRPRRAEDRRHQEQFHHALSEAQAEAGDAGRDRKQSRPGIKRIADCERDRRLRRQPPAPDDADGASMPGSRLLPDSLFGVPQTIIVPKGKPEVLAAVNSFIDDVRASGLLQRRDRQQRRHRPRAGAGRLLAAVGSGLITGR